MICSVLKQFENAIEFNTSLVNESKNNFQGLLDFLVDFGEKYDNQIANLPYHINVLTNRKPKGKPTSVILLQLFVSKKKYLA